MHGGPAHWEDFILSDSPLFLLASALTVIAVITIINNWLLLLQLLLLVNSSVQKQVTELETKSVVLGLKSRIIIIYDNKNDMRDSVSLLNTHYTSALH